MISNAIIGFLAVVSYIILAYVVARKYDKLLHTNGIRLPQSAVFTLPDIFGRATAYSIYIIRGKPGKRDAYRKISGDFNFRTYATKLDLFLIILHFVLAISFVVNLLFIIL